MGSQMKPIPPSPSFSDEFTLALTVIATIVGSALYIAAGITAYKLHSLDSILSVYGEVHTAREAKQERRRHHNVLNSQERISWVNVWKERAKLKWETRCSWRLGLVRVGWVLFWPVGFVLALAWGVGWGVWKLGNKIGKRTGEGDVMAGLRRALEREKWMPVPRFCRWLMVMERKRWGSGGDGGKGIEGEEVELADAKGRKGGAGEGERDSGVGARGGPDIGASVGIQEGKASADEGKEALSSPPGESHDPFLGRQVGAQEPSDGIPWAKELDSKGQEDVKAEAAVPQPQAARTSPKRGNSNSASLWTIREVPETLDDEIERLAVQPVQLGKQGWSPL